MTKHYVDECRAQGHPEMERMRGHVARRAKELLDDGVPAEQVREALTEFVRRQAKTALALAEISVELEREKKADPASRPEARRRAKAWIEQNGWPTGARFVRGSHSGSFVYHPLGRDRPERDWSHPRPTFDEIVRALTEEGQS